MVEKTKEGELSGQEGQEAPTEPGEQQTPELPEKFKGKSAEEIANMYAELEKTQGAHSQEVGELRKKTEQYEQYFQQLQQQQQQAQAQQQFQPGYGQSGQPQGQPGQPALGPEEGDDEDYLSKGDARKMLANEREKIRYEQAVSQAYYAKEFAKSKYPHLFEGVEQEVDQLVLGGAQAGVVNPAIISNPQTWLDAAGMIHNRKSNYAFTQQPQKSGQPIQPVQPTGTETPTGTPQTGEEGEIPVLDEFGKEMLANRPKDMSEKEFFKQMRETKIREGG